MAEHECPLNLAELTAKTCAFSTCFNSEEHYWLFQVGADNVPFIIFAHYDGENSHGEVWISVRTTSWEWDGERTDLHDVIVHVFALWLYFSGHSCSLWEVENPAVYIQTEVYSYVIRFEQGRLANIKTVGMMDEAVSDLVLSLRLAWNTFWSTFWKSDTRPRGSSRYPRALAWGRRVAKTFRERIGSNHNSYTWRHDPTWMHFRSMKNNCVVINCGPLVSMLRTQYELTKSKREELRGETATLVKQADLQNAIPLRAMHELTNAIRKIERSPSLNADSVCAIEDRVILLAKRHLVIQKHETGRRAFEAERFRVTTRQKEQMAFLSPLLRWSETVNPGRFEALILELLALEPGVSRIRKVGPTNQPDGGRDHIAEWFTAPSQDTKIPEHHAPTVFRRVVVQCKAYSESVGLGDVTNIRDTVEHYDCGGFFLAVSSQISVGVFDRLDKLRREGAMFVDWWERDQIDQRLRDHPDVLARYSDLVGLQ